MILRIICACVFIIFACAAAFVFEAAASAELAYSLAQQARSNDAPAVRAQLYERAQHTLERSWAKPLSWHAGALETASAISLFRAEDADESLRRPSLIASRDLAVEALKRAPSQPNALIRLALLEHRGLSNGYCPARTCLERSWRAAPMLADESECVRLGLGVANGMVERSDPRLVRVARSAGPRRASQCLSAYLAPNDLFDLLMRAAAS